MRNLLNPEVDQSLIQKQSMPIRAGTLLPVHMVLCPDVTQWLAHRYHGDILATTCLLVLRCPMTQLLVLMAMTIRTQEGTVNKGIKADSSLHLHILNPLKSKINFLTKNKLPEWLPNYLVLSSFSLTGFWRNLSMQTWS